MAPDLQEATQSPHPLQSTGLTWAFPGLKRAVSSINEGAEYGHIETQTPQLLQTAGMTSAMVPLV
jgi:hypothetical protein